MGLEVEKVQGQFIFLKIDSLFQQNMCQNGAWCPCSYYISTFEHYPYFPLIFESFELHETKLICESQGAATFVHRLDFAIMTMNDH
jgi:hypothetical protein